MTVLVTGVSGFLGPHVAEALLARGDAVLGVADVERGGDPALRKARLDRLVGHPGFRLAGCTLDEHDAMSDLLRFAGDEIVASIHLRPHEAAQPGRFPGKLRAAEPLARHLSFLELCGEHLRGLRHLVYVRHDRPSAGVIRDDAEMLVSKAWSRVHGLPQTGVRLIDTYGPWGDPPMPLWVALDAIVAGRPVPIEGMAPQRLLCVDDAASGVLAILDRPPERQLIGLPHRTYDLTGPEEVSPTRMVDWLRLALVDPSEVAEPAGRSVIGGADGDDAAGAVDLEWRPATAPYQGIRRFVAWHRDWHHPG